MMSSGQRVSTKYGPGHVVWVSRVSSNIYVRIQARSGALYIFSECDLCPRESDQSADQSAMRGSLRGSGDPGPETGGGLDCGAYQLSEPADRPAAYQTEGIDQ